MLLRALAGLRFARLPLARYIGQGHRRRAQQRLDDRLEGILGNFHGFGHESIVR